MAKLKTQEELDKIASVRLFKKYGMTLEEYNVELEKQLGVCKICSNPPKTRRLHVDHDHSFSYAKLVSIKWTDRWSCMTEEGFKPVVTATGITKSEAVQKVRQRLKRLSVRGLLCMKCNRGLELFRDDPNLLLKAAEYLKQFHTLCGA